MLPKKNKRNVIILSILAFVFLASGIFLLWRVNQEKELSPGESDAGSVGSCCCPAGKNCGGACPSYTICPSGTTCNSTESGGGSTCKYLNSNCGVCQYTAQGCYRGDQMGSGVYDCSGNPVNTSSSVCYCTSGSGVDKCWKKSDLCKCMGNCGGETPADCTKSKVCEFPKSAFLGPGMTSCTCLNWWEQKAAANSITGSYCTAAAPKCSISKTCAQYDMLDCGISGDGQSKAGCTKKTDASCKSYCPGCNNMSVFYLYCKEKPEEPPPPPPSVPVCDGGNWDNLGKPTGVYPYCSEIGYSFVAKDADGVNKSTIVVKVNGDVRVNASKNTIKAGDKEVRVKETLSTETNCLEAGDYTISAVWKDTKGAGGAGTNCTLTTSFTVAEEIKNPDWDITKIPVESCIDDNTENPKAKLEYVITVKNKGEGSGEIVSIVDTLDSKVLEEYIEEISSDGEFSGGKISWLLTGTDRQFAPGQSKTYTYSYIVPKDAFGTYDNTVEAVPSAGSSLIANASIIADCIIQELEEPEEEPETPPDEPLPGTGIFDDGQGALILGFALLFLGFTWRILGRGIIVSVQGTLGFVQGVNEKKREEVKKKFESKVIRDKK